MADKYRPASNDEAFNRWVSHIILMSRAEESLRRLKDDMKPGNPGGYPREPGYLVSFKRMPTVRAYLVSAEKLVAESRALIEENLCFNAGVDQDTLADIKKELSTCLA